MHSSPVISIQLAGQPAMLASKQEFVPLLRDQPVTVISLWHVKADAELEHSHCLILSAYSQK